MEIVKAPFITFVSKKIPKSVVTKPPVMKITISAMIKSYEMNENCYDFYSYRKKKREKKKGNSISIKIHEYFPLLLILFFSSYFSSHLPALSFEGKVKNE